MTARPRGRRAPAGPRFVKQYVPPTRLAVAESRLREAVWALARVPAGTDPSAEYRAILLAAEENAAALVAAVAGSAQAQLDREAAAVADKAAARALKQGLLL